MKLVKSMLYFLLFMAALKSISASSEIKKWRDDEESTTNSFRHNSIRIAVRACSESRYTGLGSCNDERNLNVKRRPVDHRECSQIIEDKREEKWPTSVKKDYEWVRPNPDQGYCDHFRSKAVLYYNPFTYEVKDENGKLVEECDLAAGWAKTETETYVFSGIKIKDESSYVPYESEKQESGQKDEAPKNEDKKLWEPRKGATACTKIDNYPLKYSRPLQYECELWDYKGEHLAWGKFKHINGHTGLTDQWDHTDFSGDTVAIMRKDVKVQYDHEKDEVKVYGLGEDERMAKCRIDKGYCVTKNHMIIFEEDEQFLPANSKLKFKGLPLCDPTDVIKRYQFKEAPDCSQFEKEEAAPIAAYVHTPKDTTGKVVGALMFTVVEKRVVDFANKLESFMAMLTGGEPLVAETPYPPTFNPDKIKNYLEKYRKKYEKAVKHEDDFTVAGGDNPNNLFDTYKFITKDPDLLGIPKKTLYWDNKTKTLRNDNTHVRDGEPSDETFQNAVVQRPKLIYYDKITGRVQSPQDVSLPADCKIKDGYCIGKMFAFSWDVSKQEDVDTMKNFYNDEKNKTMVTITVKDDKYKDFNAQECSNEKYWIDAENSCKIHNSGKTDDDCTVKVNMCGNRIRGRVYFGDDNKFNVITKKNLKEGKAYVYPGGSKKRVTFKPPFFNYLKVRENVGKEKQANILNILDHTTNLFHRDFNVDCTHAKQCDEQGGWGYRDCFCTIDGSLIGIPKGATEYNEKFDADKKIAKFKDSLEKANSKKRRRRGVDESRSRRRRDASEDVNMVRMTAKLKVQIMKFKLVFSVTFSTTFSLYFDRKSHPEPFCEC